MSSTHSLPHWVRLRVTGRDRAKFLHNFCTNDVKALSEGTACEAFFTDVKARIIAHGYVIAFGDRHEIWLLAGTEADLQKHLTRYIITDDVAVTMPAAQKFAVTVSGLESVGVVDRLCGRVIIVGQFSPHTSYLYILNTIVGQHQSGDIGSSQVFMLI